MKKRIAIVTWTRWRNYGTILQSFALQKVVQQLGYDVYVLRDTYIKSDYDIANYKVPSFIERLKAKIRRIVKFITFETTKESPFWSYDKELYEKCERFRSRNIRYWDVCYDNSNLSEIESNFDAFICGSDQIWISSDGLFSSYYFLDFVKQKPKISYAPSISNSNYSQSKLQKMANWLSDFHSVSVREEIGKKVLSAIYSKKIEICIDPTLLLSRQEWMKLLNLKDEPADYVFCYFLGNQTWYKSDSIEFCKKNGLLMVYPPMMESDYEIGNTEYAPDPQEFVELILNSKWVLTDSLHALIFSFIFRKEVLVFPRFAEDDPASENSRIEDFLQTFGLQDRMIKKRGRILQQISPIDYSIAAERGATKKDASINFLSRSLGSIKP